MRSVGALSWRLWARVEMGGREYMRSSATLKRATECRYCRRVETSLTPHCRRQPTEHTTYLVKDLTSSSDRSWLTRQRSSSFAVQRLVIGAEGDCRVALSLSSFRIVMRRMELEGVISLTRRNKAHTLETEDCLPSAFGPPASLSRLIRAAHGHKTDAVPLASCWRVG